MSDTIEVSVVVPSFERKEALLLTLENLARCQIESLRWECLVIDDGSRDGTEETVRGWLEGRALPFRYLRQDNAGPAAARNRGAREARGRVLIFIDNDILVQPDFVLRHLDALRSHPGCWAIGRIVNPDSFRATAFGRYRDALLASFQDVDAGDGPVLSTGMTAANLSLPAADFARLGGFDERFSIASCEDWELGHRAREAGITILYHHEIVALHNDWAGTIERFCERQRLYSVSDVLLWRMYGARSPRAALIRANGPVSWREDSPAIVVKKIAKQTAALAWPRRTLAVASRLVERVAPDSRLNRKLYTLLISLAILSGVREGLRRYAA